MLHTPLIALAGLVAAPPAGDTQLTLDARRALAAVPQLRHLNVGVSAEGGVVTLWGEVPDYRAVAAAVEATRHLPGVKTVKSECHLPDTRDRLRDRIRAAMLGDLDLPPGPVGPMFPPGGARPPPPAVPRPAEPGPKGPPPVPKRPPAVEPAKAAGGRRVEAVPASDPDRHTAHKPSLADAVDRLRRADPRWAQLRARELDGTVVVSGWAPTAAAVWDFVRGLRRVPGVKHIVKDNVRTR